MGRDLSKQTSASFALRTHYERTLMDVELWLWGNADTLGPRPEVFSLPTVAPAAPAPVKVKRPIVPGGGGGRAPVDEARADDEDEGEGDDEEEVYTLNPKPSTLNIKP